jgi:hypothetical protein
MATDATLKISDRAREMYAAMTKVPIPYQLVAYTNAAGDDVPPSLLTYPDPWEVLHYDALPLTYGKILHAPYGAVGAPQITRSDDPDFSPVANGFEAMQRMLITNVLLYPSKDGHMAQS